MMAALFWSYLEDEKNKEKAQEYLELVCPWQKSNHDDPEEASTFSGVQSNWLANSLIKPFVEWAN